MQVRLHIPKQLAFSSVSELVVVLLLVLSEIPNLPDPAGAWTKTTYARQRTPFKTPFAIGAATVKRSRCRSRGDVLRTIRVRNSGLSCQAIRLGQSSTS